MKRKRLGAYIGLWAPKTLKAKVASAAKANGRSISSEAQFRIEQSFVLDTIQTAIDAAFARHKAGR